MLKAGFKVLTDVNKTMKAETAKTQKMAHRAIHYEALRLKTAGSFLLKTGRLGLTPVSVLASSKSKRKPRSPLRGLFRGFIFASNRQNLTADVGFLGTTPGTAWQAKLAEKSAEGYTWLYKPRHREVLHRAGIHLRKGTTGGLVPGRDIVSAVIEHEGGYDKIARNIKNSFDARMRGEKV
ncbi:MAG: hypothetical protein RAO92_05795 [Candidatus Euphemobacter frigidus]|nr:hypothetical protein [Candidatus Euphemobacter frigidus]